MKDKLGLWSFKLFRYFINLLPERLSYALGRRMGSLLFHLIKRRRELAINNIRKCWDYSEDKATLLTKRVFEDVAIQFVETLRMKQWIAEDFRDRVELEGLENLKDAYEQDQGVIIFTGHIGNYELLGLYLAWLGYPVNAIVKQYKNKLINEDLTQMRVSTGAKIFYTDRQGVRKSFKSLFKNELLIVAGDQDAHEDGEFVEFLNRPASTPTGPVVFAQKTGAVIIPIYPIKIKDGRYKFIIEEAITVDKEADDLERRRVLQDLANSLEKKVEEYPEQWLWLHRRWKTKPKEDL